MISRRGVLTVISVCGVGGLAGCAGNTDTGEDTESGGDTGDDAGREECDGSPVEIVSTEEFEDSDGDPSEVLVRIQNRADVEARYTLIMNFWSDVTAAEKDTVERSGTIAGKLTEELTFEESGLLGVGYWEWDTRESECIG
jgi:hypothetical protein